MGGGSSDNVYKGAISGRFGGTFQKYQDALQYGVNGKDIGEFPTIETDDKLIVTKSDELGVHFHGRGRSKKYQEMHDNIEVGRTGGAWASKYGNKISSWDVAPSQEYFEELFRVSQNQIIWGGNYFSLPPTRCFLIWEKLTISENFTMAMCEYAWTSFNDNAKLFKYAPQDKERFHPTQKPVALYEWVISRYAKDGDKILDTHAGSGSCLVAAYNLGHEYLGIELDPYYFQKAEERLETIKSQMRLF